MTTRTPVLFLVFNRADLTARVFERIREARPPVLHVSADGPRAGVAGEAEACRETRKVVEAIDWKCELIRDFAEENVGCGPKVAGAITSFFGHAERGIVLEDDCLPEPSFFPFCDEVLARYADDSRVMQVAGSNYQFGRGRRDYSYHFSRNIRIHGWATWRRAWRHYDLRAPLWPEVHRLGLAEGCFHTGRAYGVFAEHMDRLCAEPVPHTWDYQWSFCGMVQHGLSVVPNVNLIRNIGYEGRSTHTADPSSPFANMATEAMTFPLRHPPYVLDDPDSESYRQDRYETTLRERFAGRMWRRVMGFGKRR